jgi:hypothetical protein
MPKWQSEVAGRGGVWTQSPLFSQNVSPALRYSFGANIAAHGSIPFRSLARSVS